MPLDRRKRTGPAYADSNARALDWFRFRGVSRIGFSRDDCPSGTRFREAGYRVTQNWVGDDLGYRKRVAFVPPRPEDATDIDLPRKGRGRRHG